MKYWNFFITDIYMYAYTTVCIDTMYRTIRSIWIYQTDADTDLAASWSFSKVYTVHANKRPLPFKMQWMIIIDNCYIFLLTILTSKSFTLKVDCFSPSWVSSINQTTPM